MKKTVFRGIINGVEFNDVKAYNDHLSKLINEGVEVNASSSTHIESTNKVNPCATIERKVVDKSIDEAVLLPYFTNSDDYYLDLLVTDNIEQNENTRKKLCKELTNNLETIKSYLKSASCSEVQKYINKVLDIVNQMKQDRKYNDEAMSKISETRDDAKTEYEETIAEAKEEYDSVIAGCDMEENVLNSANDIITDFLAFYNDVLKLASNRVNNCDCNNASTECKCNKKSQPDEKIVTSVREVNKQKESDIYSFINKIFGVDLKDLK